MEPAGGRVPVSALSSSPSAALTSAEMQPWQPGPCQLLCCPCTALLPPPQPRLRLSCGTFCSSPVFPSCLSPCTWGGLASSVLSPTSTLALGPRQARHLCPSCPFKEPPADLGLTLGVLEPAGLRNGWKVDLPWCSSWVSCLPWALSLLSVPAGPLCQPSLPEPWRGSVPHSLLSSCPFPPSLCWSPHRPSLLVL